MGDILDEDRAKLLREFDVIRRAQGIPAQLGERESGSAISRFRYHQLPPPYFYLPIQFQISACYGPEHFVELQTVGIGDRRVVDV